MEEKRLQRQQVFAGRIIDVYNDTVQLPNGKEASREVVEHRGAVAVLAIDNDGKLVLVKQYRYPIQRLSLEIPAGKLEENEAPLTCAQRELEEETGYAAGKWSPIFSYYTSPGFTNEVIHLFLAEDLHYVGVHPDEDEFVESQVYSLEEAITAIDHAEIFDVKTITAIYWWKTRGM